MFKKARALVDFDLWSIKVLPSQYDTLGREPQYVSSEFTGTPLEATGSEATYTGACHCGAVTIALKTKKALDDNTPENISECDCSICARVCRQPVVEKIMLT